MARANPIARKLLASVVAPLVKDYGGAPKVAEIVGRHRSTVTRWVKGDIDWDGLTDMASGLRRDIVITFPAHGRPTATTKEPPPKWARALPAEVASAVIERLAEIPEIAQAAAVELGLDEPRPAESPTEANSKPRDTRHTAPPPPGKRV